MRVAGEAAAAAAVQIAVSLIVEMVGMLRMVRMMEMVGKVWGLSMEGLEMLNFMRVLGKMLLMAIPTPRNIEG